MAQLIVAIDCSPRAARQTLIQQVAGAADLIKLGLEALMQGDASGEFLESLDCPLFIDAKLCDIPRTAVAALQPLLNCKQLRMLTVHAWGGANMIGQLRRHLPLDVMLLAVTVLTSLTAQDLAQLQLPALPDMVVHLGRMALANGADGLVCSAHELAILQHLPGIRVVPGIREPTASADDQQRTATAAQAMAAGADYLVVGRPITAAPDPAAAAWWFKQQCQLK